VNIDDGAQRECLAYRSREEVTNNLKAGNKREIGNKPADYNHFVASREHL
jgi:hypothetical protein